MSKNATAAVTPSEEEAELDLVEEMAARLERRLAEADSVPGPAERPDIPELQDLHPRRRRRGDQRAETRVRKREEARIVTRRLEGGVDCNVLDTSSNGARLKPLRSFIAPKVFALIFGDGSMRICETVWQGDITLGVRYLD
jgi:hypothetical protein